MRKTSPPPPATLQVNLQNYPLSTNTANATQNLAVLQAAVNYASSINAGVVGYPQVIPINGQLTWPANVPFDGKGMTFDATNQTTGSYPNTSVLYVSGSATSLGALSVQSLSGTNSITLASPPPAGVVNGSIVFIVDKTAGSFNAARTYYYLGEAATVSSVSGSTITFNSPLRYSYVTADLANVKVTWVTPTNVIMKNFTVKGVSLTNASYYNITPVTVNFGGPNFILENVAASGSANSEIFIENSYGTHVYDSFGDNTGASIGPGTDYGIVISNSQNVLVDGGRYVGMRHGATFGGSDTDYAITNFNVGVINSVIVYNTSSTASQLAADFHGNTDSCFYKNNLILGGVDIGGTKNVVQNNTIISGSGAGYGVYAVRVNNELKGFENYIVNNTMTYYGTSTASNYGTLVSIAQNSAGFASNTTDPGTFHITGNQFNYYLQSGASSFVYQIGGRVGSPNASAGNPNVDLTNDTFTLLGTDGSGVTARGVVLDTTVGGTPWNRIDISNTKGDVGFSLQLAANVVATNVNLNDLSGTNFHVSLIPLYMGDISGSININGLTSLGNKDYGMYLGNVNNAFAPVVNAENIYITGGTAGVAINLQQGTAGSPAVGPTINLSNVKLTGGSTGAITESNKTGSLSLSGYNVFTGTNSYSSPVNVGTATLVGGTVTVSNTMVTANSKIAITLKTVGGLWGLRTSAPSLLELVLPSRARVHWTPAPITTKSTTETKDQTRSRR